MSGTSAVTISVSFGWAGSFARSARGKRRCTLLAKVSRATFARRFTEVMGEPPISYLAGWRLCLAADLLQESESTLASIARQVGYSNAYALSAAFTREYGIRPSQYRHRVRTGANQPVTT